VRPIRFGLFYPQVGQSFAQIADRVRLAERLGFDSVLFTDHLWSRGRRELDHLEAWTLITAVAAVTERIRVGALVLCNSFRNPALLAKMASSLDVMTGGRLLLGIGAGWMEEEYEAYGYDFPSTRVRIEQLEEALEIIKRLFTGEEATFQGKYYAVHNAVNLPRPIQRPHPPLLVGGGGERRMLRVVARYADVWNCPNNHAAELPQRVDVLRAHCAALGRDPREIEISEQCVIVIGRDERAFREKYDIARRTVGTVFDLENVGFRGTPEQVVEQVRQRIDQGVTFFTFLTGDLHDPETLQLLAERVLPEFRNPVP
jgi:F420-dependent oxidoreductase-like protein